MNLPHPVSADLQPGLPYIRDPHRDLFHQILRLVGIPCYGIFQRPAVGRSSAPLPKRNEAWEPGGPVPPGLIQQTLA